MPEPATLEERLQKLVEDHERRLRHLESLEMVPADPHVFWQRTDAPTDYLHQRIHGDMVRIYDAANVLMAQFDTATQQMTYPTQACFSVGMSADMLNLAINVNNTVLFDTEIFDLGDNFNPATYTFTAPVTGKYLLIAYVRLDNVDSAATYIRIVIHTTSRVYIHYFSPLGLDQDVGYVTLACSAIAHMDAGDTAFVSVRAQGGAAQMDVILGAGSDNCFMGWLLG